MSKVTNRQMENECLLAKLRSIWLLPSLFSSIGSIISTNVYTFSFVCISDNRRIHNCMIQWVLPCSFFLCEPIYHFEGTQAKLKHAVICCDMSSCTPHSHTSLVSHDTGLDTVSEIDVFVDIYENHS